MSKLFLIDIFYLEMKEILSFIITRFKYYIFTIEKSTAGTFKFFGNFFLIKKAIVA